jgi:hypothetical protein
MDAKEARELALKVNTNAINSQYAQIKKRIEDAVKLGNYETFVYAYIKPDVRKKLQEEGFSIGLTDSIRNEDSTKISW